MNDPYFFVDCELTNPYPIEIRRLLSSILTTAYHDLFVKDVKANREAKKWFLDWKDGMPNYITFKDCYDYLMLTEKHKAFFDNLVR